MEAKRKLQPVLDEKGFWLIGPNPNLAELNTDNQECVDHHVFQSEDGKWHLWSCIRGTKVGRVLYHWEADHLWEECWQQTGEWMRALKEYGESIDDWNGEEWIQSPFVVKEDGLYYMFFGGHGTGINDEGQPQSGHNGKRVPPTLDTAMQMCLQTSKDGRNWERYQNEDGYSRLFISPGEVRDPCLLKDGDVWRMYYAGYYGGGVANHGTPGIFMRTSTDLIHWSDWKLVHTDRSAQFGGGDWDQECPHVVKRGGYYYMFRTEDYYIPRTHVFRSEDPEDFGIGDASDKYVGLIRVAAPEIIVDPETGDEYITSNHNLKGGTMITRLRWVDAE